MRLRPIYRTADQVLYEDQDQPGWGVVWDVAAGRGWRGVYLAATLKQHGYWEVVPASQEADLALPTDAPLTEMPLAYRQMFDRSLRS